MKKGNAWSGMPHKRLKGIERYVQELQKKMLLEDWRVKVCDSPCDDYAFAMIETLEMALEAELSVCKEFLDLPLKRRRQVLMHEVLHLHHKRQTNVVSLSVPKLVGDHTYEAIAAVFDSETEYMVDTISRAFAQCIDDSKFIHHLKGK